MPPGGKSLRREGGASPSPPRVAVGQRMTPGERTTVMTTTMLTRPTRRTLLRGAAAAGAAQLAAPFAITARAADEIKIGLNDPLTGTYAELGKNEQIGCELAIAEINAKGG